MELWQNTNFKKNSYSHMCQTPLCSSFLLVYFYPPRCSCFPVCLQSKLLGDMEDGETLTVRFSTITETPGTGLGVG